MQLNRVWFSKQGISVLNRVSVWTGSFSKSIKAGDRNGLYWYYQQKNLISWCQFEKLLNSVWRMKRISWNIDEVFPHLQKGSCDRCKECKQEISWLWMCPTWQTITVAFWSFLQFSIINVKLTFSDPRLRFIYVLEAAPISTRCHCHSIQFARDKCHARERTRIFNMAEHWEVNKRVDRNIDNNEFYLYKAWWKFCFMQWNSLWPSRRST